jgi:hypothetical protein
MNDLLRKLLRLVGHYPQGLFLLSLLLIHPQFSRRKFMAFFRQQVQVSAPGRAEIR